jgi:hypothetical protein
MDPSLVSSLFSRLVERLQHEEPDLQAVLIAGSHARGEPDAFSDVDLVVLTLGDPRRDARTWFETTPDGRLIHISIAGERLAPPTPQAPATWSLGFPSADLHRWVWATPHAREILGSDPTVRAPAAPAELEDFVELALKVQRAAATGDTLLLRWGSRTLAEYATGLLREFNPERVVRTPLDAWTAAMTFPTAPGHYREDFEICSGLKPAGDEAVHRAATRLVDEMLDFLRVRCSESPDDDIRRELVNGTLHSYVAQSRR